MSPQVTAEVVKSATRENGKIVTQFRVPALTKLGARQRIKANTRFKGMDNPQIIEPEVIGQADIPGFKLYEVEVTSNR